MKKNFEDTMELINLEEDLLKNKELKKLIEFKAGKTNIEKNDLIDIKDIILDGKTITGNINIIYFEELELFPNLNKIEIKNTNIPDKYIKYLEKIEEISLKDCEITHIEQLEKITKLSINNSKIGNIEEISNLKNITELELINVDIENFEFLKKMEKLKTLRIKNVKNFSMEKIDFFLPIEYLSIEGIEKISIDIIEKYSHLKVLSIDRKKQEEWKENLEKIEKKGIKILLNDIYEY